MVKNGNILAADYVLNHLGIKTNTNWGGSYANGNPIWGTASSNSKTVNLSRQAMYRHNVTPNVMGMGASDAVYMLESRGIKVKIQGRGKVVSQSYPAGKLITRGAVCTIKME